MQRQRFESLLRQHQDPLHRQALAMLGDADEAQDVVQDSYLKLWARLDEVEDATCRAWLAQVVRNGCLDRIRRQKVRRTAQGPVRSDRQGLMLRDDESAEATLEVSDLGTGVDRLHQQLDAQRLVAAMEELKEPWRSIILLREVHDLPYEEIATRLDLSLSAVKVYLHRARRRLRELFEDEATAPARGARA